MKRHTFDTNHYDFKALVEEFLSYSKLEEIHLKDKFEKQLTSSDGGYGDQQQKLHRMFYNKLDTDGRFIILYNNFIKQIIAPLFSEEIYYQKYPTFRIHQPDNICVFKWHRDKDFGHNENEINFFMPLTKAQGNNTIWVEKFIGAGKNNIEPLEGEYGDLIQWHGAQFLHGNKNNDTKNSRVSFDFRILKKKDFNANEVGVSLTKKVAFSPESYFTNL